MSPTLAKLERKITEVLRCGEEAMGKEESEFRGKRGGENMDGEEVFLSTFSYLTFESCDCTILPKFLK